MGSEGGEGVGISNLAAELEAIQVSSWQVGVFSQTGGCDNCLTFLLS